MAEVQMAKIKSLYGEARGILLGVENSQGHIEGEMIEQYEKLVIEIEAVTNSDYSRLKPNMDIYYSRDTFLPKVTSLVVRLENEYGFNLPPAHHGQMVVVTVDQAQHQIQTTQVNIDLLISQTTDIEAKEALSQLKLELNKDERDPEKLKKIVTNILNKGWDLFIVVLPYILEHWGKR